MCLRVLLHEMGISPLLETLSVYLILLSVLKRIH